MTVIETPDGILIASRERLAMRALDRVGEAIRKAGVSLDELIESSRDERAEIMGDLDGGHPDGRQN